jgi:hypothetical protein
LVEGVDLRHVGIPQLDAAGTLAHADTAIAQ